MATTQYTGARYVPLFAEPLEWDNKREFEPLTMVLHMGASYTSRQYVPKGIDINNEQFWALTGNYNAQVEQYRREVLTFNDRIDKNTASATENKAAIAAETERATAKEDEISGSLTAEIARAKKAESDETARATAEETRLAGEIEGETARAKAEESRISNEVAAETTRAKQAESAETTRATAEEQKLRDSITKVEADIAGAGVDARFVNEHIIMVGDSYAVGTNAQGYGTDGKGWFTALTEYLGLNNAHTYEIGGGGFSKAASSGPNSGYSFATVINKAATELAGVKDKVTHVLFAGGWNDGAGGSTVSEGIATACANVRKNFPNATIEIAMLLAGSIENTHVKGRKKCITDYRNASLKGGAAFASCLTLPWWLPNQSHDGVHPSESTTTDYIVPFLARLLVTGHSEDYIIDRFNNSTELRVLMPFNFATTFNGTSLPATVIAANNNYKRPGSQQFYFQEVISQGNNIFYPLLEYKSDGSFSVNNLCGASPAANMPFYLMGPQIGPELYDI
nr:MAG TPA: hypothetical protein [Bacteriophage sp.]